MRIVLITGDQRRHLALAARLRGKASLVGLVVQKRQTDKPDSQNFGRALQILIERHFTARDSAEEEFFQDVTLPESPYLEVNSTTLNSIETFNFLKRLSPDLVLSWGCGLISDRFLDQIGAVFWNIHGGLSPRYRGSATLFWPNYFLEPNWSGLTLHRTTKSIDGGQIIHQIPAQLVSGDGIQMHSARAVNKGLDEVVRLLEAVAGDEIPLGQAQTSAGKLFLARDWRPDHLRVVYELYEDRLVDLFLNGEILGRPLSGLVTTNL